jgi:transposase-like protein
MAKRRSYTAEFKLKVVTFAEKNGNRKAERKFEVDEKSVRQWRQLKKNLAAMKPRAKSNRGRTAKWPLLEANLKL